MADGRRGAGRAGRLNIGILAVGKAGRSPEAELCARYLTRAQAIARSAGVTSLTVRELSDGAGQKRAADETARLLAAAPAGTLIALDERGAQFSTVDLDSLLRRLGETGESAVTFAIGGADGHGPGLETARTLSLSAFTLPHLLARAILLEQIYRVFTIRIGHPYHRA